MAIAAVVIGLIVVVVGVVGFVKTDWVMQVWSAIRPGSRHDNRDETVVLGTGVRIVFGLVAVAGVLLIGAGLAG
jgi:hypothetical protein